ncbi:hypothetical protein [Cytobacillus oceanisediminis]|uniref:hypothetical protein n=1 Tax=Cytobacillus oceanisediminis TaxID=665099 RepID=UPI0011A94B0D|nr:hypothetical protein [Cytobacillus oceanisediminis]
MDRFLFKTLIVDYGTLLIRVEGARLQREKRVKGKPRRRKALDRPQFAKHLDGNQQASLTVQV